MHSHLTMPRLVAIGLALATTACSASTAHIGSMKVGKDSALKTSATTFGPHDKIYAAGDADNVPDKVKLEWHLVAENVRGVPKNQTISQLDKSFDFDSDATATYDLSPPAAGWPVGKYKIVLTMMEDGKQQDQKTAEFTVAKS